MAETPKTKIKKSMDAEKPAVRNSESGTEVAKKKMEDDFEGGFLDALMDEGGEEFAESEVEVEEAIAEDIINTNTEIETEINSEAHQRQLNRDKERAAEDVVDNKKRELREKKKEELGLAENDDLPDEAKQEVEEEFQSEEVQKEVTEEVEEAKKNVDDADYLATSKRTYERNLFEHQNRILNNVVMTAWADLSEEERGLKREQLEKFLLDRAGLGGSHNVGIALEKFYDEYTLATEPPNREATRNLRKAFTAAGFSSEDTSDVLRGLGQFDSRRSYSLLARSRQLLQVISIDEQEGTDFLRDIMGQLALVPNVEEQVKMLNQFLKEIANGTGIAKLKGFAGHQGLKELNQLFEKAQKAAVTQGVIEKLKEKGKFALPILAGLALLLPGSDKKLADMPEEGLKTVEAAASNGWDGMLEEAMEQGTLTYEGEGRIGMTINGRRVTIENADGDPVAMLEDGVPIEKTLPNQVGFNLSVVEWLARKWDVDWLMKPSQTVQNAFVKHLGNVKVDGEFIEETSTQWLETVMLMFFEGRSVVDASEEAILEKSHLTEGGEKQVEYFERFAKLFRHALDKAGNDPAGLRNIVKADDLMKIGDYWHDQVEEGKSVDLYLTQKGAPEVTWV